MQELERPDKNRNITKSDQLWKISGYADDCEITLRPYEGIDFSKRAILFCGQGQMTAGAMQDSLESHSSFVQYLNRLDQIAIAKGIGEPSKFITDPEGIENNALYSELCLYTLQVAMFETVLKTGIFPEVISSHSFGEFALLTSSGVMSFEDMVEYLIVRHQSVAEVGAEFVMFAATNWSQFDWEKLPYEVHQANINTKYQSSFVCKSEEFQEIKSELKRNKIACVKLDVRNPYHTPWLSSASEKIEKYLSTQSIKISPPKIAFVSSVLGRWVDEQSFAEKDIREILIKQLIHKVNFPKQVEALKNKGFYHFLELSPIDVLGSMVEQYFTDCNENVKVGSFQSQFKVTRSRNKTYEKFQNSKVFNLLDGVLKTFTGYSIQNIQLEDRIREDLGIDSIKKAEIVFEILDSLEDSDVVTPANLSDLSTFGDVLEYFETVQKAAKREVASTQSDLDFQVMKKEWQHFELTDYSSKKSGCIERLALIDLLDKNTEKKKISENDLLIIESLENREGNDLVIKEIAHWISSFQFQQNDFKKVIFLNRGHKADCIFSAFFRSYALEKEFTFKDILFLDEATLSDEKLYLESLDFYQNKVKYEGGKRWIRGFRSAERNRVSEDKQYKKVVVFGGFGGIGEKTLSTFSHVEEVVIVGRKNPEDKVIKEKINSLKKEGQKLEYHQMDLSNQEVQSVLSWLNELGSIDLVVHSIGFEKSEELDLMSEEDITDILSAKIQLAQVLKEWASVNPNSKVIFQSSIVSEFGSRGQSVYAVANEYLNKVAEDSENITSILWPGWKAIGVAGQGLNSKSLKLQGAQLMNAEKGVELFQEVLSLDCGVYAVLGGESYIQQATAIQFRHEFSWLMKPASSDGSLFVIPGLTQESLPYLSDHLVKKACIFPASGYMALMLTKAYLQFGKLGSIEDFVAHNFLVVGQDSSNVMLESKLHSNGKLEFKASSHQLLANSMVHFEEVRPDEEKLSLETDQKGLTLFDNNASVYLGPRFELANEAFINSKTEELALDCDLTKAPVYLDMQLMDKVHRLIELSFSASCAKTIRHYSQFAIPKSAKHLIFHNENLYGKRFIPVVKSIEKNGTWFDCNITTYNEDGKPALTIKKLKTLAVGDGKTKKSKGFELIPYEKSFF